MNTPEFDESTEQVLKMLKVCRKCYEEMATKYSFFVLFNTSKYDGVILSKCLNVQIKI